jgi:hypothetical protein
MYKDALDNSMEYKEIVEKMENLKTRKKQIETLAALASRWAYVMAS